MTEKVVDKEAKAVLNSFVVDFSGLDPSPGHTAFEKVLQKYCAKYSSTPPDILLCPGGTIDCKDGYVMAKLLALKNSPHANGYTMKVEQCRPRLDPDAIYNLAYKEVLKKEFLERLNRGDNTTVTDTHCPSPQTRAVNALILTRRLNSLLHLRPLRKKRQSKTPLNLHTPP